MSVAGKSKELKKPHLMLGVIAGAAAGLFASWAMNGFQAASSSVRDSFKTSEEKAREHEQQASAGPDTTQVFADVVTQKVTGEQLTDDQKKTAGPVVHYLFGTTMGALYGGLAEYAPISALGVGTVFGSALFLGADEISLPALGFSKPPTEEPATAQVNHWTAHLVYGVMVELARRGLRRVL